MQFDNNVRQYLTGDQFSNGLPIAISHRESSILTRIELIEKQVAGKDIIHVGCTDHIPLIQEKLKQNIWMHARLCQAANRCLGLDINEEGIDYLRENLGYTDLIQADLLTQDIEVIKEQRWDYMVMGEILEHVDNPVEFLITIQKNYADNINALIITVPNAFSRFNFFNALKHTELINTDHRYWFTPYTLAKIITQANMSVENFWLCERALLYTQGVKNKLTNFAIKKYPALRDTIVMSVKL